MSSDTHRPNTRFEAAYASGKRLLHQAVELDEQKRCAEAVKGYRQAVAVFVQGLEALSEASPSPVRQQHAARMRSLLSSALDRLEVLDSPAAAGPPPTHPLLPSSSGSESASWWRSFFGASKSSYIQQQQQQQQAGGYLSAAAAATTTTTTTTTADLWPEIAGLGGAKQALFEVVILPRQRPDLFVGLRKPPKAILLFGPPGTGKSMLARAISEQAGIGFIALSAADIMSKWVGDSEKNVRMLFQECSRASKNGGPVVVFIDEIDSMLSRRTEGENEATRRLKTEFLVQMDGIGTPGRPGDVRPVVIAATNRPFELDDAALRRFERKIFIPLPDAAARKYLIRQLLSHNEHTLSESELNWLVDATVNFSGADLKNLCTEAAMNPLRRVMPSLGIRGSGMSDPRPQRAVKVGVPPIAAQDFRQAMQVVKSTSSPEALRQLQAWAAQYGSPG